MANLNPDPNPYFDPNLNPNPNFILHPGPNLDPKPNPKGQGLG